MMQSKPLQSNFIPNFRQVGNGFYAGGQPQIPEGIAELRDVYGIRTVVDLQVENAISSAESRACAEVGVAFNQFPLPGLELFHELPLEQVERILVVVNDPHAWPVFVHCALGEDRTGAIIGIYRLGQGWSLAGALDEMKSFHNSPFQHGMRDTVEDWLEKYPHKPK